MEQSKSGKLNVVSVNGAVGAQVTCCTTILSMGGAADSARSLTQKAQRKVRAAIALGIGQKKTRQKNSIILDVGAKGSTSRLPARLQTRLSSKKIAPSTSRHTEPAEAQADPTAGIPPTLVTDAGRHCHLRRSLQRLPLLCGGARTRSHFAHVRTRSHFAHVPVPCSSPQSHPHRACSPHRTSLTRPSHHAAVRDW